MWQENGAAENEAKKHVEIIYQRPTLITCQKHWKVCFIPQALQFCVSVVVSQPLTSRTSYISPVSMLRLFISSRCLHDGDWYWMVMGFNFHWPSTSCAYCSSDTSSRVCVTNYSDCWWCGRIKCQRRRKNPQNVISTSARIPLSLPALFAMAIKIKRVLFIRWWWVFGGSLPKSDICFWIEIICNFFDSDSVCRPCGLRAHAVTNTPSNYR